MSENEAQLHYFEVHTAEGRSHGHLGTFPVENTGSGVAVALKRPVLTSKDGKRYIAWNDLKRSSFEGMHQPQPLWAPQAYGYEDWVRILVSFEQGVEEAGLAASAAHLRGWSMHSLATESF